MLSAAQQIDLMTCQWVSTCSMENTALYRLSLMSSTHRSVIISILVCLHWQAVNAEGREHIFSSCFFFLPFYFSKSICLSIEQMRIWVFWGLDNYLLWVWKCNRVLRILEKLCYLPGAQLTLAWQLNRIIVSDAVALLLFWNILEASHFVCEEHCACMHRVVSLTFGENENSWVPLQERANF